jgi:hypothetical protein
MTFKNSFIKHSLTPDVEAWIKEEVADQEARYLSVSRQMAELAPLREKWYQEFFDRLTTTGFNEDGDQKILIETSDLPVRPDDCDDKVVWKYGIDEE